ncbi:AsnC family transcriptional regulator [Hyphomonas polymorpha PS728]|uniref:AsnC family transcriptional regulator n=1 Tax=Hyphomonas polymorpha PS728 TaxID=1280954 RepID=A0A062VI79_9PROT|nr:MULTISPECIES: Lrp/AsnC family transcriptional regulator [Hyphomonas]AXE63030.1 AsnC family transcriptional regulator [Hyphomonas sp. CACIAM 19H1]KDA00193.1 AsnC family transcriptional regulator [Hyphomonas polymorpha PS728]
MDAIDAKIVRALQRDGRLTNLELAEEVGLSPSPCLRRVKNLEAAGIIQGYSALVDQKACGFPITCLVRIRLANHGQDTVRAFEQKIAETDAVLDCYLMTGGADYELRVVARSLDDYEQLVRQTIQTLPGIASIETSFAYGVVKKSRILPVIAQKGA